MNQSIGKLFIVIGLPGAGKSWLIETQLKHKVTGCCIHDFHAKAIGDSPEVEKSRYYANLARDLGAGRDCIIADIAFCCPSRRNKVVETLRTKLPTLAVEYHCFRNQPERCIKNIRTRNSPNQDAERRNVEILTQKYVLPNGAIEYEVSEATRSAK